VTAKVSQTGVADTTSGPDAGATVEYGYGPVWASDNITRNIVATPVAGQPGEWTVQFTENGTYSAFADPNTEAAWTNTGNMHGSITYTIQTTGTPNAANLPSSIPGMVAAGTNTQVNPGTLSSYAAYDVHGHGYIMEQLFGAPVTVLSAPYSYHYTQVQDVPGIFKQVG
jgi:hypothetical protein